MELTKHVPEPDDPVSHLGIPGNYGWIRKYDHTFKKYEPVLDLKEIALESVAIFFLFAIPYFAYRNSLPY